MLISEANMKTCYPVKSILSFLTLVLLLTTVAPLNCFADDTTDNIPFEKKLFLQFALGEPYPAVWGAGIFYALTNSLEIGISIGADSLGTNNLLTEAIGLRWAPKTNGLLPFLGATCSTGPRGSSSGTGSSVRYGFFYVSTGMEWYSEDPLGTGSSIGAGVGLNWEITNHASKSSVGPSFLIRIKP